MKALYDYIAIIAFFVTFKLYGIYTATAVAIAISAIVMILYRIIHKKFEKTHIITFVAITILGGATLIFHNDLFIKWKPSVIYWIFAIVLLGSNIIGSKPIMERIMGDKIPLPAFVWHRINLAWGGFFLLLGFLNVYVIYHFSTSDWVNFKLFGTLILTFLFAIGQAVYMSRYMKTPPAGPQSNINSEDSRSPQQPDDSESSEAEPGDSTGQDRQ